MKQKLLAQKISALGALVDRNTITVFASSEGESRENLEFFRRCKCWECSI